MKENKTGVYLDRISIAVFAVISVLGAVQAAKYLTLGIADMALTALILEVLIVLVSWAAWQGRMPFLLLLAAAGGFVLNSFLNYAETTKFASFFLV